MKSNLYSLGLGYGSTLAYWDISFLHLFHFYLQLEDPLGNLIGSVLNTRQWYMSRSSHLIGNYSQTSIKSRVRAKVGEARTGSHLQKNVDRPDQLWLCYFKWFDYFLCSGTACDHFIGKGTSWTWPWADLPYTTPSKQGLACLCTEQKGKLLFLEPGLLSCWCIQYSEIPMSDHQGVHPAQDPEVALPQTPKALLVPGGSLRSDQGEPGEHPPFQWVLPVVHFKPLLLQVPVLDWLYVSFWY